MMNCKEHNCKIDIINEMQKALEIAKSIPLFYLRFKTSVPNAAYEEYIRQHPLVPVDNPTQEEIDENVRKRIEEFHTSDGYNPDGSSIVEWETMFNLSDITYERFRKIMMDEDENMPIGYCFINGFYQKH